MSSNPEPINIITRRVWDRLCALARQGNVIYTIDTPFTTPDDLDPDLTAMCRFIMTFYPEDAPLEFDDD